MTMMSWALLTDTGCIACCGLDRDPPKGHVALPHHLSSILDLVMWSAGDWLLRPTLAEPVIGADRVTVPGAPEGTTAMVYDPDTGAVFGHVTEGEIDIHLPDPGRYGIEIMPPEPWVMPAPLIIEVAP